MGYAVSSGTYCVHDQPPALWLGGLAFLQEVLSLIARLPRLVGVEHVDDCPDQAKPLRWRGTSTQWDGDLEISTARFSCSSCGLDVELIANRDSPAPR